MNVKVLMTAIVAATVTMAVEIPKDADKDGGAVKLSGAGKVAAVVCCDLDATAIKPSLELIDLRFNLETVCLQRDSFNVGSAAKLLSDTGANIALFIVDELSLPYSLVAPEAKWGLVNVAVIKADHPDTTLFTRRLNMLSMRTLCRLLGSDAARARECCNFPAYSLKELDAITGLDPSIEAFININEGMKYLGLEQTVWGTYRDACALEIAKPPTNELQRAIAAEVAKELAVEKAKEGAKGTSPKKR